MPSASRDQFAHKARRLSATAVHLPVAGNERLAQSGIHAAGAAARTAAAKFFGVAPDRLRILPFHHHADQGSVPEARGTTRPRSPSDCSTRAIAAATAGIRRRVKALRDADIDELLRKALHARDEARPATFPLPS